jgi:glutamine amidotransferase
VLGLPRMPPAESAPPAAAPAIVIVDYGLGNLGSVANMLKRGGVPNRQVKISSHPEDVARAEALILPGVGAFDHGMQNLESRGLIEPLRRRVVEEKTPLLGICLGMQLLGRSSEEGERPGLGWLDAETRRFTFEGKEQLAVPHMGWNSTHDEVPVLFEGLREPRFYFVHSFHLVCRDPSDVAARCTYGVPFTAAVRRGNIYGTQFHPEKSHKLGMQVLQNFVKAARRA